MAQENILKNNTIKKYWLTIQIITHCATAEILAEFFFWYQNRSKIWLFCLKFALIGVKLKNISANFFVAV